MIVSFTTDVAGQIDVHPRRVKIVSTDSLATVTTAGYLDVIVKEGFAIYKTDIIDMIYLYNPATHAGTYGEFLPTIAGNGVITLTQYVSPGDVTLPVVNNDFANFDGTTGKIKDAGYSPSDATKTKVVMAGSATVIGNIAKFVDITGTVDDTPGAATNLGNILAGASGTAGTLSSFPATAANGSLVIAAINAGGAFITTISNATMGQSTVYTIPDAVNALGRFLVGATATPFVNGEFPVASGTGGLMVTSNLLAANIQDRTNIKAQTTSNIGGGGAGPILVNVPGLSTGSAVIATVEASTNPVSVIAATAVVDGFNVTFSADPGATCTLNFVAFVGTQ